MKVLVTGAFGFIGSHITERLISDPDIEVLALDNFCNYYDFLLKRRNSLRLWHLAAGANATGPVKNHYTVLDRDIREVKDIEGVFAGHQDIDTVIHLAGHGGVRASLVDPVGFMETNVVGTATVLEGARRRGVKRFINVSSSTVYGPGTLPPFKEGSHPLKPICPYGVSKLAAEQLCHSFARTTGMGIITLRPFSIYGKWMRPDLALPIFAQKYLDNKPIAIFGDGSQQRDLTHVSDFCDAVEGAMRLTPNGDGYHRIYNVGRGEPLSLLRMVEHINDTGLSELKIQYTYRVDSEMYITHADISLAARDLGFSPKVNASEGISDYVNWMMSKEYDDWTEGTKYQLEA